MRGLLAKLTAEQADREEVDRQLSDREEKLAAVPTKPEPEQKSATAGKEFPEAADLLNQLKAKRKKSKTDLADIEAILAMIEE